MFTTKVGAQNTLDSISRGARRSAVIAVMAGYPLLVAAWAGLPALGLPPVVWAIVVGALGLVVLLGSYAIWSFRQRLAQAPDEELDERQIAVRDRAYLDSYRALAGLLVLGLLAATIVPDAIDRPVQLTFETIQPVMWGAILYAIILPSAVVAWREPDLADGQA